MLNYDAYFEDGSQILFLHIYKALFYLFLDMKFFVETVVSMVDMAGVFVFMYDLL